MIQLGPLIIAIIIIAVVVLAASWLVRHHRPAQLDQETFKRRWKELQTQCGDQKTWPLAIIDADKLVDEALKKCHYRGKTMGERLVSAQHDLSANDMIWFGHKLRNKLVHEEYKLTSQKEVKEALLGFLQALKDVGAIK
jgi:hypothetical protein